MAKVKLTILVPEEIATLARDTVVSLSGPPNRLTLAKLAEDALKTEIERLQKKHNKGKPFPSFKDGLKGGRPIGG